MAMEQQTEINFKEKKNIMDDLQKLLLKPDKTFRDAVHGDIMLTELEVKLIDTKDFQRLRGIRQLGTSHLVFYCANHTRFDHSIGCVHVADKIIDLVNNNPYADIQVTPYDRFIIRICALLHDLSHVPFGHTLEDEAGIFRDEHGIALGQWKDYNRVEKFLGDNSEVASIIKNYSLLNELAKIHNEYKPENILNDLRTNIKAIEEHKVKDLKKPFIADIIGNTLCADLLDYIKRDIYFTGLKENYDERFLSYLYITNYEEEKNKRKPRLVLRLHKPKNKRLRRDVQSELLHLLRLRYSLAEKVYYHHAKISSSAMIISAVTSLFVEHEKKVEGKKFVKSILYDMSDDALINFMKDGEYSTDVSRFIINNFEKHSLYKPVYGLRFGGDDDTKKIEKGHIQTTLVMKKEKRYKIERYLEHFNNLPAGSIIIYCPDEGMGAKAAEVLVHTGDKIGPLKEVAKERIKEEIKSSIIQKHKELWCMYVLVDRKNAEDKKLMSEINGDCESIFEIKNELEECKEFHDNAHQHYLDRFEDKFVSENTEIKRLTHEQIHSISFRTDPLQIEFGNRKVNLRTYEEYKEARRNL